MRREEEWREDRYQKCGEKEWKEKEEGLKKVNLEVK